MGAGALEKFPATLSHTHTHTQHAIQSFHGLLPPHTLALTEVLTTDPSLRHGCFRPLHNFFKYRKSTFLPKKSPSFRRFFCFCHRMFSSVPLLETSVGKSVTCLFSLETYLVIKKASVKSLWFYSATIHF